MADTREIRRDLGDEREKLADAVGTLREEVGRATERGRRIGIRLAAIAATAGTLRLLLRLRRR
jgi:hypothetical protein